MSNSERKARQSFKLCGQEFLDYYKALCSGKTEDIRGRRSISNVPVNGKDNFFRFHISILPLLLSGNLIKHILYLWDLQRGVERLITRNKRQRSVLQQIGHCLDLVLPTKFGLGPVG